MSEMEGNIDKETIKQVLLDINPLVRQFHKNVIELHTGVDPAEANELNLKDSIHFLKHIWGSCLYWGNQSINSIGRSIKKLSDFLNSFTSRKEIHNHHVFLERLEQYPGTKRITPTSHDPVVRLTELLQKFPSVRIKTTTLIMRFLSLDCSFFEVNKSRLIPPLDRVNYRMCRQLFGEEYVLDKFRKERASFGIKATMNFDALGEDVLGGKKVLIDNLWFIGHFYHDAEPENKCKMRGGAKIVDYPLLENIIERLSETCPFLAYSCERSS